MLDIKILRQEPEKIKEALKNRNNDLDITPAIELDVKRREILQEVETKKAKQNTTTSSNKSTFSSIRHHQGCGHPTVIETFQRKSTPSMFRETSVH